MFTKLAESYSSIINHAREVQQTVAQQAREVLGLDVAGLDGGALEHALETEAANVSTPAQAHELAVRWAAQILSDDSAGPAPAGHAVAVYRYHTKSFSHAVRKVGLLPMLARNISLEVHDLPQDLSGDLASASPWIVIPAQSTAENSVEGLEGAEPMLQEHPKSNIEDDGGTQRNVKSDDLLSADYIEDGLTFRQVFLKSQALEFFFLSIARREQLRTAVTDVTYCDNTDVSGSNTTFGALSRLLLLCLRPPKKPAAGNEREDDKFMWKDLLFLICTVDLRQEYWELYLRQLIELIALKKHDWLQETLRMKIANALSEIASLPSSKLTHCETHSDMRQQLSAEMTTLQNAAKLRLKLRFLRKTLISRQLNVQRRIKERVTALTFSVAEEKARLEAVAVKADEKGRVLKQRMEHVASTVTDQLNTLKGRIETLKASEADLQKEYEALVAKTERIAQQLKETKAEKRELEDNRRFLLAEQETALQQFERSATAAVEQKRRSGQVEKDLNCMESFLTSLADDLGTESSEPSAEVVLNDSKIADAEVPSDPVSVPDSVTAPETIRAKSEPVSKATLSTNPDSRTDDNNREDRELANAIIKVVQTFGAQLHCEEKIIGEAYTVLQELQSKLLEEQKVEQDVAEKVREALNNLASVTETVDESAGPLPNEDAGGVAAMERDCAAALSAAEAATGGIELLRAAMASEQRRVMTASQVVESIWKDLLEFLESIGTGLPADNHAAVRMPDLEDMRADLCFPAYLGTDQCDQCQQILLEVSKTRSALKELHAAKANLLHLTGARN